MNRDHSVIFETASRYCISLSCWPITSWEIDGETVETVRDFILGGSKITADGDCSHEIKRCLLLGRKVITNLDSILKSKDIKKNKNKKNKKQRYYFANKGLSS